MNLHSRDDDDDDEINDIDRARESFALSPQTRPQRGLNTTKPIGTSENGSDSWSGRKRALNESNASFDPRLISAPLK